MQESEARAIVEKLAGPLKAMREAGLSAAEISAILTARAKAKGLRIEVQVAQILPGIDGLEIKMTAKDAMEMVSTAEDCPHPHVPCPSCQEAICFMGKPPKTPQGVCAHCGAFLLTHGDPAQVRLMTDEDVLALNDDQLILLQRSRRTAEKRRAANRSPL